MRFFIIFCTVLSAFAQPSGEFSMHPNGLIYAEESVIALRHMVAVEDRNFYACPVENTYMTPMYILTDLVVLEADERTWKSIRKFLEQARSADDLVARFPDRVVFNFGQVPVIRYRNYDKSWTWKDAVFGDDVNVDLLAEGKTLVVGPQKATSLNEGAVAIVFFPKTQPTEKALAQRYASMVDYVDCMVGTTPIFQANQAHLVLPEGNGPVENPLTEFNAFLDYADRPEVDWQTASKDQTNQYFKDIAAWNEKRRIWIREIKAKDPQFRELLKKAVEFVELEGGGTKEIEDLAHEYLSKADALKAMRGRVLVGDCSMDQSPRIHAQKVASLAAETTRWEIFLRAHLNILNDRFERRSDGSYAFGRRKTYFRELEALGLDLPMLIAGLALDVTDAHPHHYFGSPMRLGRALAEADDPQPVVDELLEMLADPALDPPNKWQLTYVLINYLVQLEAEMGMQLLDDFVADHPKLPGYFESLAAYYISN